jgi:hypothetical protein
MPKAAEAPVTELAQLPPVLGMVSAEDVALPQPVAPKPAPAPEPAPAEEPDDDGEELSVEELGALCGDIYADVFGVAAQVIVGVDVELADGRAERRGRQLAVVLRKLGWADDEILAYTGLGAGVAGDVAILVRMKRAKDAEEARAAAQKEAQKASGSPQEARSGVPVS